MPIKVIKEGENQREICVLSYSSYSTYKQCPQRYYREKVLKEVKREDETFTIPGRIVHNAAENYFKTGSLDQFEESALLNMLAYYGNQPTVNYEKAYGSFDKAKDLLLKSATNLRNFVITREPGKQLLSEQWFGVWNAPLYLSENLAIQGAADLIEVNPNGTAILYDFKTTYQTKYISRDQLILYAIAAKLKWNINVTMALFFLLPTNKQNFISFNESDKQEVLRSFQSAANDILTNREKLKATKNDKCKFCPFYDSCEVCKEEVQVTKIAEGTVSFNMDFNSFGAEL